MNFHSKGLALVALVAIWGCFQNPWFSVQPVVTAEFVSPQLFLSSILGDGNYQSASEEAYSARPTGHLPFIELVVGVSFLFLGFFSGLAAQQGASYADDRGFPWWVPFLVFIGLAYWFAYQGLMFLQVLR